MTDPADTADGGRDARADIRVLLVDDNETWLQSTAELLEQQRASFTVETATDLETAADALTDAVDCIVCDYDLESGTGLDLLADVRAEDDRPFVLITGQGSEDVASDAIGQQVTDYIPKRSLGGRSDLLARRVEAAVESYRTEKALARERRSKDAMLDILQATSSREGLARAFCDHLVRERDYACAWIGTVERSGGVVPRAAAGSEGYVEHAIDPGATPETGTEPALAALATGDLQVVAPIEDASDGWQATARAHDFGSAVAIPVAHEGTTVGVLAVYRTGPAIEPEERTLLDEYGATLGYALRSAEWKESLLSTTPATLVLELTDDAVPLVALDRQLPEGSRIDVLTTVLRAETLLYVLEVAGGSASDVEGAADSIAAVETARVTRDSDPLRCEVVVERPTPETLLAEFGGQVRDVTVADGHASITVDRPTEHDVQALVDTLEAEYGVVDLRSLVETGGSGPETTAEDLLGALTDKQHQALELAFFEGYFQRPREHDAIEIAEKLGVSRQTFAQHLRTGQRKLLGGLFESSAGETDD